MLTERTIEKLEKMGFRRWTKGNYDRMYINAKELGLDCSYYKTGNISSATFRGEKISNSAAGQIKYGKYYVDVKTGEIVIDGRRYEDEIREIVENMVAEATAEEKAEKVEEIAQELGSRIESLTAEELEVWTKATTTEMGTYLFGESALDEIIEGYEVTKH